MIREEKVAPPSKPFTLEKLVRHEIIAQDIGFIVLSKKLIFDLSKQSERVHGYSTPLK
jgi:hypothetical protein